MNDVGESSECLLHWLNSLGLSTTLLVDDIRDLKDGVVLCDVACLVLLRVANNHDGTGLTSAERIRKVGGEPNVCSNEDADMNLEAAARVAHGIDKTGVLQKAFMKGDRSSIVLALLRVFKKFLTSNKKDLRQPRTSKKPEEKGVEKKAVVTVTRPPIKVKPLDVAKRPPWNASTSTLDQEQSKLELQRPKIVMTTGNQAGKQRQPILCGSLVDPTYKTDKPVSTAPKVVKRKKVATYQPRNNDARKQSTRLVKPIEKMIAACDGSISALLFNVGKDPRFTSSLHSSYKIILNWLMHPAILPSTIERLESFSADCLGLDPKSLGDQLAKGDLDLVEFIAELFKNGLLLCELVRKLDFELGGESTGQNNRMKDIPIVEKIRANAKLLVYSGVSLRPVNHGAKVKNVNVALSVLKNRPKMDPRNLYSAENIVRGDPPAIIWELLADLRALYDYRIPSALPPPPPPQALPPKPTATHRRRRNRSASLDLDNGGKVFYQPNAPRASGQQQQTRRRRSNSLQSQPNLLWDNMEENGNTDSAESRAKQNPLHIQVKNLPWQQEFCQVAPEMETEPTVLTSSQEQELMNWLVTLGFSCPQGIEEEGEVPLLQDPTRNGVLFWDLFSQLDPQVKRLLETQCTIHRPPKSIAEATQNTTCAFHAMYLVLTSSLMRGKPFVEIEHTGNESQQQQQQANKSNEENLIVRKKKLAGLLRQDVQGYIKGNKKLFWGLLRNVQLVYGDPGEGESSNDEGKSDLQSLAKRETTTAQERLHDTYRKSGVDIIPGPTTFTKKQEWKNRNTQNGKSTTLPTLPYTEHELDLLDQSLRLWLVHLEVLDRDDVNGGTLLSDPTFRKACVDGTLFAQVAAALPNHPGTIKGIFHSCKTSKVAKNNLEKVLDYFRSLDNMSRRFLFSAEQIQAGERRVILGFLEDIHRFEDDLLPHPAKILWNDKPYFGKFDPSKPTSTERKPLSETTNRRFRSSSLSSTGSPKSTASSVVNIRRNEAADIWPTAFSAEDVSIYNRSKISLMNGSSMRISRRKRSSPKPKMDSSILAPDSSSGSSFIAETNLGGVGLADIRPVPHSDIIPSFKAKQKAKITSYVVEDQPLHSSVTSSSNGDANEYIDVDQLADWLTNYHRLPLRDPNHLKDFDGIAPEFNDGTLLCALVERLEHVKGGISGVQQRPKTTAACLHNIRSALAVLQNNRKIPPKYLWSEREIAAGKVNVIVPLLHQLHKVYPPI